MQNISGINMFAHRSLMVVNSNGNFNNMIVCFERYPRVTLDYLWE